MSWSEKLRGLERKNLLPVNSEEAAFNRLLGFNIATERDRKKMGQREMARQMGITQSSMSKVETGATRLTVYDLTVCAMILGVEIDQLIPTP